MFITSQTRTRQRLKMFAYWQIDTRLLCFQSCQCYLSTRNSAPEYCTIMRRKQHESVFPIWSLQWRYNERDDVSNHQLHNCLPNRLFRQIKENTKAPRHWPLCGDFYRWPLNSPHKGPVTRKNHSIWWRHHVGFLYETSTRQAGLLHIVSDVKIMFALSVCLNSSVTHILYLSVNRVIVVQKMARR